jgi:uncharacterized protein with LGFP repeats
MSKNVEEVEQISPARQQWLKDLLTETGKVAKHHSQAVIDCVDMGDFDEAKGHAMAAMSALQNDLNHYTKVVTAMKIASQSDRWKKCLQNETE